MDVLRNNPPKEFSNQDDGLFVRKGEIGILWDGSNSGEIISINQDGILSSTVSRLGISDSKLNKEFSYYILKFYEKDFRENTIGMGIPHMDGNHLKFSKIILPPLSEQQQIVSFLDDKTQKIDSLIQQKQKKIELLKEKRTSLINHVVTKGLDPNVEMKDSGVEWIGKIPIDWFSLTTNKIFNNLGSGTTPKSENSSYYQNGKYPWITTTDLNEGIMYDTKNKLTDESISDYPNLKLYPIGSIYISMYGGKIGKIGVSTFSSYCNQSVCVLPSNKKVNIKFYYYWFLGHQERVKNMGRGGGQPNINKEMIKEFRIVKPSLSEQQQIVEYLDKQTEEIDTLIQLEQKKIETLKEYRQSLISEVVTGKIRVCEEDNSLSLNSQTV